MSISGIFYGRMATPTKGKGTLPPPGEFAFFIDSADDNMKQVDSLGAITNITLSSTPGITTLVDGANIASDGSISEDFEVTLEGNRTLDNPTNLQVGTEYKWVINQDATGSRTLAYGSAFLFEAGSAPVLSTAASATDVLTCYSDGTDLFCTLTKDFS